MKLDKTEVALFVLLLIIVPITFWVVRKGEMKVIRVFAEEFGLTRKHWDDAGWDIRSMEDVVLQPGEVRAISTGVYLVMPEGVYAQIFGRSGLAVKGIDVFGGVIDAGYRGEVKVVLYNAGKEPFVIRRGDRIAQLVFLTLAKEELKQIIDPRAKEMASKYESERGERGFGSSGK